MKEFLQQYVCKSINLLVVMCLFNLIFISNYVELFNDNYNKNLNIITEVLEFETIKKYDSTIPSNISNVLVNGVSGLQYVFPDGSVNIVTNPVSEEILVGTGIVGVYNGIMTGYGPDCVGCSGLGYVACRTYEGSSFSLVNDGIYYADREYGSLRVVAAAHSLFPCGTVVEVKSSNLGTFLAVVLDTGGDMRSNLSNGIYHFDVAYTTQKDESIKYATNNNVVYTVQRWGW